MAGNGLFTQRYTITDEWQALAPAQLVITGDFWAMPENEDSVQIRVNGGDPADVPPGARFKLEGADLSSIEVKGTADDAFCIAGHTR